LRSALRKYLFEIGVEKVTGTVEEGMLECFVEWPLSHSKSADCLVIVE
jgi:hypothetical protein